MGGGGGRGVVGGNWIYFEYWQDINVVCNDNTASLKTFQAEIHFSLDAQHNSLLHKL